VNREEKGKMKEGGVKRRKRGKENETRR